MKEAETQTCPTCGVNYTCGKQHVWINSFGSCQKCQDKAQQEQPSTDLTQDLAMMNRRLVLSVQRLATFDSKHLAFADRCQSWLRDKGLAGTPLREGELNGQEAFDDWKHPDDSAVEDDKAVDAFAAAANLAQGKNYRCISQQTGEVK